MSDAAAVEAPPAVKSGGGSSKLVLMFLMMNFLVMVGGGAFLYMRSAHAASVSGQSEASKSDDGSGKDGTGDQAAGPTVRLADFVIHLRNPEADRYARVSFDLELISEADKTTLTPYLPRIRDAFISYLSDRTAEELRGSEGLVRIKKDLQRQIDDLVPGHHVRSLYIADFVIQ